MDFAAGTGMSAQAFVQMIEEMVDLKIQHYAELQLKPSPEVARVLQIKRETDHRRIEQIKAEMARLLGG